MKKRILWALLTVLLLVGLLSTTALAAETEEIPTPGDATDLRAVQDQGNSQALDSEKTQLYKLAAPTDLAWHKYYPYGCTGTDDYFTYNGMMSWIVGDPDYNQVSRVTVYKDDEEQYWTEWTYDTEWADRYYTDWDLSLTEFKWCGDGNYRFTVQAVGDGVTTADSEIVSSDTWAFTMPDSKIATPTNLTWDGTTAKWTEDDNAAGYVIEILYSADDGAATSTKSLIRKDKYVQYYGESGDTNGTDDTAGFSMEEPGYYYFSVYSVSNDITKNWHSDTALSPAYELKAEEPENGYQMTLEYNPEQCTVTVKDRENGDAQVVSGDYLMQNSWGEVCAEVVVDVKDGYRIKSVNLTQSGRTRDLTEDFIIGVYGWKPMLYASSDFTLEIETEKVPPLPTVTDVRLYLNEARTHGIRPGSNLTITKDEIDVYVKATYSDGGEYQYYTARGFMEYSLDGKTWETTTMGGYYPYFPVAACQYEDKFDTSSTAHSGYDFRIRIEPDDKYCTGGTVYSDVYHVNGGADGTAGDLEVEPLETPVLKVTTDPVTGQPKLSWNAVEGATQYMVYSAPNEDGTDARLEFTTETSMIDVRATAGIKYYYQVTAFDEYGGQSEASKEVSCVCDLPRPEVKISVVASTGKLKLSWGAIDGAIKYEVHRSTDGGKTYKLLKTTTGTSLTNTSATAGNKYYYKVKAIHSNSNANSAYSSVKSGTCDLARPELKISVVSSTGKLKLRWDAIDGAIKYEVHRSTDGGKTYKLLKTTTGTSLTNTSITAGNKYYYKVKAIHSKSSANSAYSSVKYGTCDLARPELKISVVSSTGKLKLSWGAIDGAIKYEVHRSTDGGKTYKLLKTTTGTSLTNTSITAGNKYYYKVKAIHSNTAANSAFSSVKYGTCDLARPTATVKLNSSGKPVVSWAKVEGAVKYTVYIYDAEGELVKTSSTTGVKLTHSSAVKGKTYSYRVVAVHSNTAANSAKSIAVSIKSK